MGFGVLGVPAGGANPPLLARAPPPLEGFGLREREIERATVCARERARERERERERASKRAIEKERV